MRGDPVSAQKMALAGGGTALAAALCLAGLVRLLRNEKVVFGR